MFDIKLHPKIDYRKKIELINLKLLRLQGIGGDSQVKEEGIVSLLDIFEEGFELDGFRFDGGNMDKTISSEYKKKKMLEFNSKEEEEKNVAKDIINNIFLLLFFEDDSGKSAFVELLSEKNQFLRALFYTPKQAGKKIFCSQFHRIYNNGLRDFIAKKAEMSYELTLYIEKWADFKETGQVLDVTKIEASISSETKRGGIVANYKESILLERISGIEEQILEIAGTQIAKELSKEEYSFCVEERLDKLLNSADAELKELSRRDGLDQSSEEDASRDPLEHYLTRLNMVISLNNVGQEHERKRRRLDRGREEQAEAAIDSPASAPQLTKEEETARILAGISPQGNTMS